MSRGGSSNTIGSALAWLSNIKCTNTDKILFSPCTDFDMILSVLVLLDLSVYKKIKCCRIIADQILMNWPSLSPRSCTRCLLFDRFLSLRFTIAQMNNCH